MAIATCACGCQYFTLESLADGKHVEIICVNCKRAVVPRRDLNAVEAVNNVGLPSQVVYAKS